MARYALRLSLLFLVVLGLLSPTPHTIARSQQSSLQLWQDVQGVHVTWQGTVTRSKTGIWSSPDWAAGVDAAGLPKPHLFTVLLSSAQMPLPQVEALELSRSDNEGLQAELVSALSDAPVSLLRTATLRGTPVGVVAVTPVWKQHGALRAAASFRAVLPGASLWDGNADALWQRTTPFITDANPPNPAATTPHCVVHITQAGMQELNADDLARCGFDPATVEPTSVRLERRGSTVAIQITPGEDGKNVQALRWYAPPPGDRWNSVDLYWLMLSPQGSPHIGGRAVPPQDAPLRTTGLQTGMWQPRKLYDARYPGADGDHWFAAELRTGPGQPPASLDVVIAPTLPPTTEAFTLTLTGAAVTPNSHYLRVTLDEVAQETRWTGTGTWTHALFWRTTASQVQLALTPATQPDVIVPNSVSWIRPVELRFGGQGATFTGVAGHWRYLLDELPSQAQVYDITQPANPQQLQLPADSMVEFEDGPAPRHYLVVAPNDVGHPTVLPSAAFDLGSSRSATLLYIAPQAWHAALAPLVAQRQQQGWQVEVVDLAAIYAGWSGDMVDPEAIRSFLRWAAATWPVVPQTVVLVGDGTLDGRNYLGRNNPQIIPPYLAPLDYEGGETACETCYSQLDGATPVANGRDIPDLQLGRLPVHNVDELQALVAKLLRYDAAPRDEPWRKRAVFVADNYQESNGQADLAGDFAALSDASVALQPSNVTVERMYYDPWQRTLQGQVRNDPWRIAQPDQAWEQTRQLLNAGAALVNYTGHASQFQWATNLANPLPVHPYLLQLYEADILENGDKLPVLLEMTCLTSAFHTLSERSTTLDERLLLHPQGGVAAVWGPTGIGLSVGHDALQAGFYRALWQAPAAQPLGKLVAAGYLNLWATTTCCANTPYAYALLGDPATVLQVVQPPTKLFLPQVIGSAASD